MPALHYHRLMEKRIQQPILKATGAREISHVQGIQPLWNNYGMLSRVFLKGGGYDSVIVKHIQIPDHSSHPRGFGGDLSRSRKIRSYEVETHWYQEINEELPDSVVTPRCLASFRDGGELFLLLEDLNPLGFTEVLSAVTMEALAVVLRWLAGFHAHFLGHSGEGLWPTGTYWHLETRPAELERIAGTELHRWAGTLDGRLRGDRFPTLVHGDAKLANFLFQRDRRSVAAVDFQYVGVGSAMKDVAYCVGSCLRGDECEAREEEILQTYFEALHPQLPTGVDGVEVEREWRALYPLAWADFERFMQGWSPGHRKLTPHSDATTRRALSNVIDDLLEAAKRAARCAGEFICANRDRPLEVHSKGMASEASDVVTEIDIEAQRRIVEILGESIVRYDLGLLAEEGDPDASRLRKHAFWAVDPLDGTQFFIEGKAGFATSIALVDQRGNALLGVAYDPVRDQLFEAVAGRGVRLNSVRLQPVEEEKNTVGCPVWFADRSLRKHPRFQELESAFDLRFAGGAVVNCLELLQTPGSVYFKMPKKEQGGCAIWDVAAVSLMLEELGGNALFHDGSPLHLNRRESLYFNDRGLLFASPGVPLDSWIDTTF